MKYCKYCNTILKDDDLFCYSCGNRQPEEAPKSSFSAGGFIKKLILIILPVISIAMLFLGWASFKGSSAGNINAIISSCAGYTDNRVITALGDGTLAPIELQGMADSVSSIASFLSFSSDTSSLYMVENIFRIMGLAVILAIVFGIIAIVFRAIGPLKNARNLDFAFFFLQILLFIFFLVMCVKINKYIDAFNSQMGISAFFGSGSGMDIAMKITPWSIIALICSLPSCLIDLIRFPGEKRERKRRRSPLPVITAIGSVFITVLILGASAFIFVQRTNASANVAALINGETVSQEESAEHLTRPEQPEQITSVPADAAPETAAPETAAPSGSASGQTAQPGTAQTTVPETASPQKEFVETIRKHLPIVTYACPSSGAANVYAYSGPDLSTRDSNSFIDCYGDEILIDDITDDGKAVLVKYPAGSSYKIRWFQTSDILGGASLGKTYTASKDATSYNLSGPSGVKEQGYIGVGEEGIIINTRTINGTVYEMTLYPIDAHTINEVSNVSYRIAWIVQGSYK